MINTNNTINTNYGLLLEQLARPLTTRDSINNEYFNRWNSHIMNCLNNIKDGIWSEEQGHKIDYYNTGDWMPWGKCLLREGEKHAKNYSKLLNSNNILLMTHSLFPLIIEYDIMNDSQKKVADQYKENYLNQFSCIE